MKVIVGLGNPGDSYRRSRHNVGFLVTEKFSELEGFPRGRRRSGVLFSEKRLGGERVFVLKPQTYMNLSGPAVRGFLDGVGAFDMGSGEGEAADTLGDRLLIVHDDLDLPAGRLRYRGGGSSGGHRGVASVIDALGTDGFSRLKVGIGRPEAEDAAEYVLAPVEAEDEEALQAVAEEAARSLPVWVREGTEAAANRFNGLRVPPSRSPGEARTDTE